MGKRLGVLMAVVAVTVAMTPATRAGASVDVGGWAAGVLVHEVFASAAIAELSFSCPAVLCDRLPDLGSGREVWVGQPVVTLDSSGGNSAATTAGISQRGISTGLLTVSTLGSPAGNPFAESTATVEGVGVPGVAMTALRTHCRWDNRGSEADTTGVLTSGATYRPLPGARLDLPNGLGYAVFNEQDWRTLSSGARVVTVTGLHVYFADTLTEIVSGGEVQRITDIAIDVASCDPNNIPPVGTTTLSSTATSTSRGGHI